MENSAGTTLRTAGPLMLVAPERVRSPTVPRQLRTIDWPEEAILPFVALATATGAVIARPAFHRLPSPGLSAIPGTVGVVRVDQVTATVTRRRFGSARQTEYGSPGCKDSKRSAGCTTDEAASINDYCIRILLLHDPASTFLTNPTSL